MMKYFLSLFLVFQTAFCFANSANPAFEGDNAGSAYSSKDVDILKEKIILDLRKQVGKGFYTVIYHIKTDKEGKQIPLLFNAMNYADGFAVWVDDRPVKVLDIPKENVDRFKELLKDFGDVYHKPAKYNGDLRNSERDTIFSDYKYFEAPLNNGEHIIKVQYFAEAGGLQQTWVNRYDFNYSLWPASYWRSYGSLEIQLYSDLTNKQIETNLGAPVKIVADTMVWRFDKLPVNVFQISYTPKTSWFADLMISIGPFGFAVCFAMLMLIVQTVLIKRQRKTYKGIYSSITIGGGLVIPVLMFVVYFGSFTMIDWVIGAQASRFHYVGFTIVFYPFVAIIYLFIICVIDWYIRWSNLKRASKVVSAPKN